MDLVVVAMEATVVEVVEEQLLLEKLEKLALKDLMVEVAEVVEVHAIEEQLQDAVAVV